MFSCILISMEFFNVVNIALKSYNIYIKQKLNILFLLHLCF